MLLVSRRVDESLAIGDDIEVKVISVSRSRVMLAVTAPREVSIRRIYGKSDHKHSPESHPPPSSKEAAEAQETEPGKSEDAGE